MNIAEIDGPQFLRDLAKQSLNGEEQDIEAYFDAQDEWFQALHSGKIKSGSNMPKAEDFGVTRIEDVAD